MHTNTIQYYDQNAPKLAERYQAQNLAPLHAILRRWLNAGMRVLEIGCGSGRDAQYLASLGCRVIATDASDEMLLQAQKMVKSNQDSLIFQPAAFPLAEGHELLKESFDAIVAIAFFMHVPDHEFFQVAYQIRSFMKKKGIFICSFCRGRPEDLNDPRLFVHREPGEVQLLFERIGFHLLAEDKNLDAMERGFDWTTLVFAFDGAVELRPLDQIESIINRDSKTSTYKLALLRALCEIAQTAYHQVRWHSDDTVSLPLGLIAEKWFYYYWPLFDSPSPLPEMRCGERAKGLAFKSSLEKVILHFSRGGGLDAFHIQFQSGKLNHMELEMVTQAFHSIAKAIIKGPVYYSGGSFGEKVFGYEPAENFSHGYVFPDWQVLGQLFLPASLWREMVLVGHWISQAIVLRWAELSFEFAKKEIPLSDIISRLIRRPETERNVSDAKNIYRKIPDLSCVWSNQRLRGDKFDADHIIPFSLWHNNDLWNLLPAASKVNNQKRDKIISDKTLKASEERVVYYWRAVKNAFEPRFQNEIHRTLLGGRFDKQNWEKNAFAALLETSEMISCQRGVERWEFDPATVHREAKIPVPQMGTTKAKNAAIAPQKFLFRFTEVMDQIYINFLPLVADMAAGPFADNFFTENLDDSQHLDWVEVPPEMCQRKRFIVRVAGDSMEPLFQCGDFLVFEYHRMPRSDGQIVLAADFASGDSAGTFAIKRFRVDPERWVFESENPKYPPVKISKCKMDSPILGIFVGKIKRET
jgi:SOS-response transcriptional repressor LexA/SAM-dependent methyltransferase